MPHSVRQQRLGGHRESRHRAVFGSSAVMLIAAILLVVGLVPPEALAGQINLSEPGLPEALATEVPPFEVPSLPINPFEPGGPQVGPPPATAGGGAPPPPFPPPPPPCQPPSPCPPPAAKSQSIRRNPVAPKPGLPRYLPAPSIRQNPVLRLAPLPPLPPPPPRIHPAVPH